MTNIVAAIFENDQERDRKTCVALDLKVTGANRELAQWLLDHPRYPATVVAGWLVCGETRIKELRRWAQSGFADEAHPTKKRQSRNDRRRAASAGLKSLNNLEDEATEEIDDEDSAGFIVAIIKNATEKAAIAARNLDGNLTEEERAKIVDAIDAMMRKWKSLRNKVSKQGEGK